ncbi:MAG: LysR family transcriptional regulator [Erysipelotrichaceae bacterium]|nr:LysR family transcriptional regulator [Erysipelotrichaceae bacterium]
MIETYLLEQFLGVVEYKTLSAAAEELHISQPSLSRSMKKLEEELGVPLFTRENSKIILTETGKEAAEYAKRALQANQELIDHVRLYERSLNSINIGSCAPFPLSQVNSLLQENFYDKTLLSELADDDKLIKGLKNHYYQFAILHELPDDEALFVQRYIDESLLFSLPKDHPFADRKELSFSDLKDLKILLYRGVGFWMKICENKLPKENLFIQDRMETLIELIEATAFASFSSDVILQTGTKDPDRVYIPLKDKESCVTYYLACLNSDKKKYDNIFNSIRSAALRRM